MGMETLKIIGGEPLRGSVKASGAKNAITKMLCASLISNKKCTFYNVPNITEVEVTVELCLEIGAEVQWDRSLGCLEIHTKELKTTYIPQRFSGANRIPILMIGALLGRTDADIVVPTVGGCNIGKRPVTFHIDALRKLGAEIEYREMKKDGAYFARAHKGLTGTILELPYPSVGATENCILAACRAKGRTVIQNAAIESEIIDLVLFLQKMGVNIFIDVNRTVTIEETKEFFEIEHTVLFDRIETASLGMAAISTKGKVYIEGAKQNEMITFLNKLRKIGGDYRVLNEGIEFFYREPLKGGLHLETDVHPGFMTDWQQPFVVLLTQAEGFSVVHETVYENRFGYTQTLNEMGADIQLFEDCLGGKCCRFQSQGFYHSAVIKGITPLKAKEVAIPDLRAGFAYVMAALIAEGESVLTNLHYLDRGYESLEEKLTLLGAKAKRSYTESISKMGIF
jgi:UDP-N-acetylglucosamine 1-carboxyvinyltransferase